jgi:PE-PPE domain
MRRATSTAQQHPPVARNSLETVEDPPRPGPQYHGVVTKTTSVLRTRITLGLIALGWLAILTAAMNPVFAYADPIVEPSPSDTYVMGATGLPDPASDSAYLDAAGAYLAADLPGTVPVPLVTPEDLAPLSGTLTFNESVSQGVSILNNTIGSQLDNNVPVGVVGVSQSAVISSLEMEKLDPAGTPSDLPASFVLLGDPMNPDGGLLERFPGLGYGATPSDDFPTAVYTHEYDPFADFCQYPIDVVCDVNAIAGIAEHSYTASNLATAFQLPTEGATDTTYYMIPTPDLPLTALLSDIPVIGTPLADLLQPDLTYLVNLGYGDPDYGYSTGPANIDTPAELFPPATDLAMMPTLLWDGAEQGIQNFIAAF